jgi:hypothetical protein
MRVKRWMLIAGLCLVGGLAGAVGIADQGTYRPNSGEAEPAAIEESVRIVPPPLGGVLQVSVRTDRARYHVGEQLQVYFGVNKDAYVYIFDTDAAGLTKQIFPNYYDTQNFLRAGKRYFIPDRSYDLEVTPPSGRETLTIVAVLQEFPFLSEYRGYTRQDPYPASREGASALVRRIESFRAEKRSTEIQPVRPMPKENLWAEDTTTFYVMGRDRVPPPIYKVPRYGWLDVDTYPSNARIYIDGDHYGRSPQVIGRLEIGYHHIKLMKEGYTPYECDVYIKGNETKHLDIFLDATPTQPGYERGDKWDTWGFFYR